LLELFAAIKRTHGTSILFVSHNLAVVRSLCERVLIMYLGRVVERDPPSKVFERPRHPYTRMLLASVPLLDPRANARASRGWKLPAKPRRRSSDRADALSAHVVRTRGTYVRRKVQSQRTSRRRTRWPASAGVKSRANRRFDLGFAAPGSRNPAAIALFCGLRNL
jgi:ABC-type dipeptide/oligopeptide/nickel transport system ATPase component